MFTTIYKGTFTLISITSFSLKEKFGCATWLTWLFFQGLKLEDDKKENDNTQIQNEARR